MACVIRVMPWCICVGACVCVCVGGGGRGGKEGCDDLGRVHSSTKQRTGLSSLVDSESSTLKSKDTSWSDVLLLQKNV